MLDDPSNFDSKDQKLQSATLLIGSNTSKYVQCDMIDEILRGHTRNISQWKGKKWGWELIESWILLRFACQFSVISFFGLDERSKLALTNGSFSLLRLVVRWAAWGWRWRRRRGWRRTERTIRARATAGWIVAIC